MLPEQQIPIPSGKPQIDKWLKGGYPKSTLTMVASHKGAGKTKWILESAITNAQNGIKSLHISLDSTIEANIDFLVYIYGIEEMKKKSTSNLNFAELEQGSLKKLDAIIEENVLLNDVEVIFIDSIEPIIASYGDEISSYNACNLALKALSNLAERHQVPIVIERTLFFVSDIGEPENLTIADISRESSLQDVSFVISIFREKNTLDSKNRRISIRLLQSSFHEQRLEYHENFNFAGDLLNDEEALN